MNADFGPKTIYKASTARVAKDCAVALKGKHASFSFIADGQAVIVIGDHSPATLNSFADDCLGRDAVKRISNAQTVVDRSRGIHA